MTDELLGGLIWFGIFVLCWVCPYIKVFFIDDWLYERRRRKWMSRERREPDECE